jgi:hypothetical protein
LTSINLPEATSLGESVFSYCAQLTTVTIPKVEAIPSRAFVGNTGGNSLTIILGGSGVVTAGVNIFDNNTASTVTVRVPSAIVSSYNTTTWKEAFAGKGDSGAGTLNTNITVTIEGYQESGA